MAQAKAKKRQKAKPSVVYEYVYSMLEDKLDVRAIAYTRHGSSMLCLANGSLLQTDYDLYKLETPTEGMFSRNRAYGSDADTDDVTLFGHALRKFDRKKVLAIAHRICNSIVEDRMRLLKYRVSSAQKDLDDASKALEKQSKIWADLNKSMEDD